MTDRRRLRGDCERCVGLCCVVPAFSTSADFAFDKPAGEPCRHLGSDFRCAIHDRLRAEGFPGCAAYDCFGAGQRVTREAFPGQDWRRTPEIAGPLFARFTIVRQLHELLWYIEEALAVEPARPLHARLRAARDETERLAGGPLDADAAVDLAANWETVGSLLRRVSDLVRAGVPGPTARHGGADLVGATFRGADLRGADLREARLIGADLRRCDLRRADLLGADLRAARLDGADLRDSLFVTQPQLDAARGDPATRLPAHLDRPAHWTAAAASEVTLR
jgi:uncharacterized protein YjbI with pentapeptide repeats